MGGRRQVAIGLVVGFTPLFPGPVIPAAGNPERVVIGVFGAIFLVATARGHATSGPSALPRTGNG